jgi:hypothetical protein
MMAEEKEKWKIPKLTAENHDGWFRRNKVKLRGKRVFHVCERSPEEHCRIATAEDLSDAGKELDITDNKNIKARIYPHEHPQLWGPSAWLRDADWLQR